MIRALCPVVISLTVALPAPFAAQEPAPPATREGQVATADGVQLYYQVRGTGKDTIVVLHGGPGLSSAYLAPDLDLLEREFTLIHYDQRGAGRSTIVTDSTRLRLADHVADAETIRRHFGLDRVVLLGHSWGAAPAAFYARKYPERVAKLILVDAIPMRATPYMQEFGRNLRAWMDSTTQVRTRELSAARPGAADPVAACRAFWSIFIRGYMADPSDLEMIGRMKGDVCNAPPAAIRNGPLVSASALGPEGDWDWREAFHEIHVPVLVIHGDKDPIPPVSAGEWEAAFPEARLALIPGAGHFPYVEQPAAFLRAVETFMR